MPRGHEDNLEFGNGLRRILQVDIDGNDRGPPRMIKPGGQSRIRHRDLFNFPVRSEMKFPHGERRGQIIPQSNSYYLSGN